MPVAEGYGVIQIRADRLVAPGEDVSAMEGLGDAAELAKRCLCHGALGLDDHLYAVSSSYTCIPRSGSGWTLSVLYSCEASSQYRSPQGVVLDSDGNLLGFTAGTIYKGPPG